MNSRYDNLFRIFFAFTDLLFLCCLHLFLLLYLKVAQHDYENNYITFFIINNSLWLISAYLMEVYINDRILNFKKFAIRTSRASILYTTLILAYLYFTGVKYDYTYLALGLSLFLAYLFLNRIVFLLLFNYIEKRKRSQNKLIFLGHNEFSEKLTLHLRERNRTLTILGCFDDEKEINLNEELPVLGKIEDCIKYAIRNNVTEIYSTLSPEVYHDIYELAQSADNLCIRFRFVPNLRSFVDRRIYLDFFEEIPILSLTSEPLEDFGLQTKKRFFDVVFSLFVCVFILSWLVPIIAVLIKLDSKGPVFFLQERSGKNNKSFNCIKFRSLKVNNESNIKQVTKNDNRITKLGKFLRKSSLDELPQFFNVLKGDMSVVGPRPHMLKHTEDYSKIIMKYMIRHYLKPGVTGWAQVNGFRGEIKEELQLIKRIEYDVWYLENWSIWLDFKIIYSTIVVTLKGDDNAF